MLSFLAIVAYEALYDYASLREDELALAFGDRITVIEQGDDGWWRGTNSGGLTGWFPYNYVSAVEPDRQSDAAISEATPSEASDSGLSSMADEEEGTG